MSGKARSKEKKDKPIDIFISFSFKNLKAARFICKKLEEHGFTCWLADPDRNNIPPGENWARQIMQGLTNSKMVLLIFSRDSNASDAVQSEIGIAAHHGLKVLPVRIQKKQPEGILEYYLIHNQWFDIIPPPPPLEKDKLNKLVKAVEQIINQRHQLEQGQEAPLSDLEEVPFFSTWVLRPSTGWLRKLCETLPALDGALWTYLIMFLVFFIPLAISHRIVGTYTPRTLAELFRAASGYYFYYPDLNAILFDMILHPAAFATLVYFILFIGTYENQYLLNAAAGFIPTRNARLTRFWVNFANLLIVKILPIGLAILSFFYRRNVYIGYGMKEPLLFWASFAVAMSIYVFTSLSINTSYLALLIHPINPAESQAADDANFFSERVGALAKITIVFAYIILMCLVEIAVEWMMADFNGTGLLDLIRWIILIFGGLAILVLLVKTLWLWMPESGKSKKNAFRQVRISVWFLLAIPVALIILTIKLWLQVY